MNYKAIVADYIRRLRHRAKSELDWFVCQPSFIQAIEHAALATNRDGKRFSHQRRITKKSLSEAKNSLLLNQAFLEKSKSFDELFETIHKILAPIHGVGELYIYDTSLRLGAYLNLFPQKVYLHAGTRRGAEALRASGHIAFLDEESALDVAEFPGEFRILEPREIEDVLCIYKDILKKENAEHALPCRNC